MSVKIAWILLAEALAQDTKGILSVIGLSQNVTIASNFPTQTKRAIVVRLEGEKPSAETMVLDYAVLSPAGKTTFAQNFMAPLGPMRFPELPWALDIPAELGIAIAEPGTYTIRVQITIGEAELESSVPLYVLSAEAIGDVAALEVPKQADPIAQR